MPNERPLCQMKRMGLISVTEIGASPGKALRLDGVSDTMCGRALKTPIPKRSMTERPHDR